MTELTPIGDNKFIDEDGVVYDNPPPLDADSEGIMLVLKSLLGDVIRREL